jgi:hypothetical protein
VEPTSIEATSAFSTWSTPAIRAGTHRVVIQSNSEAAALRLQSLFANLLDSANNSDESTIIIRVDEIVDDAAEVGPPEFRTSVESEKPLLSPDFSAHELWISRFLNQCKLNNEPFLLHVHSAAVARGDAVALLVGRSGVGKSTLTAGLVNRGWEYATDEQVTLSPEDGKLIPYPRPITLRQSVWPLFDDVGEVRTALADDNAGQRIEIPPAALGPVCGPGGLEPVMIVAPFYDSTVETRIEPLPSTAASVELLATCCFDTDRLGAVGLDLLIQLACKCPGWRLTFSDLDDAARVFDEAFDQAIRTPRASAREIIAGPASVSLRPGDLARSPGARSWVFEDGSGVVVDPTGRRLVQLDSYGAALWELLEVPHSAEDLISLTPDEDAQSGLRGWFETLIGVGFLESGTD